MRKSKTLSFVPVAKTMLPKFGTREGAVLGAVAAPPCGLPARLGPHGQAGLSVHQDLADGLFILTTPSGSCGNYPILGGETVRVSGPEQKAVRSPVPAGLRSTPIGL